MGSLVSNPYAAPTAPVVLGLADLALVRAKVKAAFAWLGWAILAFFAGCCLLAAINRATFFAGLGFMVATAIALYATWKGLKAIAAVCRANGVGIAVASGSFLATLASAGMVLMGALAALLATFGFARGRQLRSYGRVLLPTVAPGGAWAKDGASLSVDAAAREGLAARWRENGRTEHASVAAFARLTLDLMALGAPPALVASAQRDALDEIAHTQACFALARALDGREESPGSFPEAARASVRNN